VATHKGWAVIELEPHRQYWKYRGSRRLIIYLTFAKEVQEYGPSGCLSVDVNENNVTMLVDGAAHLFEVGMEELVPGYCYRRKGVQGRYDKLYGVKARVKRKAVRKLKGRVQGRYDKLYGVKARVKRKAVRKLKGRKEKLDVRWKIANIIVKAL